MIKKIKSFFNDDKNIKKAEKRILARLLFEQRAERLRELMYTSKEMGVCDTVYCESEIIVSLTTFGKRLYDVATTIESIMQGSMLPNRIVLWLGEENRNKPLPISLQRQKERGLQIEFCKDIRSYTKLVPSLMKFPNAIIITIDDDLIYTRDLVENLFNSHIEHPECICANRIHRVVLGNNGKPVNYNKWDQASSPKDISPLNFLTGVGGVLYPPHCLDDEVFNEGVFLDICKFADDIWFYAMALKKGTGTVKTFTHSNRGEDFLLNGEVQDVALGLNNYINNNENDVQFRAVFEKYNLYGKLM